jgi:two-component system, sensor histidine kinase PdtaS
LPAANAKRTRWVLFGVVIILVLLLGLVFVALSSRRQSIKANQELQTQKLAIEEKNVLISQSLGEKEALLKEIHHRVKNNLQIISSLLNLQSASLEDSSALEAIKEGQNRVKSIALIHQKLYQTEDLSRVDFQEYCEQLVSFLQSAFKQSGKSIEAKVEANSIQLDIDTAVPLGLIINELVTNAYKYAFINQDIGVIQINLRKKGTGLQLTIRDSGVGMPASFELAKAKSLGMKLVNILSRQLKGSAQWENDRGAVFLINFKESAARKLTA